MPDPMAAVEDCMGCQFGEGAAIGVHPVPAIDAPGLPALMFAGVTSMIAGFQWQLELQVAFAGGPAVVLAFLPPTPEDFFSEVFAEPWLSGIPQPLPEATLDLGGVMDFDLPAMDNSGYGADFPELYGPGSSWEGQVGSFLKLLAILMALPFLAFWKMVTSIIDDPGSLPPLPTKSGLEDLFNTLALGAGLPLDGGVGKLGGCFAEALMSVA